MSFDPKALKSAEQLRRMQESIRRINPVFMLIQAFSAPTDSPSRSYVRPLKFLLALAGKEIEANRQVIFTGRPNERFWSDPDVVEFFQARPTLRKVHWHWCALRLSAGTQVATPSSGITCIAGTLPTSFIDRLCVCEDSDVHFRDISIDRQGAYRRILKEVGLLLIHSNDCTSVALSIPTKNKKTPLKSVHFDDTVDSLDFAQLSYPTDARMKEKARQAKDRQQVSRTPTNPRRGSSSRSRNITTTAAPTMNRYSFLTTSQRLCLKDRHIASTPTRNLMKVPTTSKICLTTHTLIGICWEATTMMTSFLTLRATIQMQLSQRLLRHSWPL